METYTAEIMCTNLNADGSYSNMGCEATGNPVVASFDNPHQFAETEEDLTLFNSGQEIADANAERAAACWNGCKGFNPAAVPRMHAEVVLAYKALAEIRRTAFVGERRKHPAIAMIDKIQKELQASVVDMLPTDRRATT